MHFRPFDRRSLRRFLLAGLISVGLACAEAEPIDISAVKPGSEAGSIGSPTGAGGSFATGAAGTTGAASNTGTAGTIDSAGTTGTAGTTGVAGTSGDAGSTGSGGTSDPAGGAGTVGTGGAFGRGGSGFGGGSTGTAGTGGRAGTTGTAGTGGRAGTTGGSGGTTGAAGAGGAATFTQVYAVLNMYCSGANCHNPGSQHGVSFNGQATAYNTVKGRVTAGNGANSSLYKTVSSGSMPPGGAKLSTANLALIKAWIDAGAMNN